MKRTLICQILFNWFWHGKFYQHIRFVMLISVKTKCRLRVDFTIMKVWVQTEMCLVMTKHKFAGCWILRFYYLIAHYHLKISSSKLVLSSGSNCELYYYYLQEIARTTPVPTDVLVILDTEGLIVPRILMNVSRHPAHLVSYQKFLWFCITHVNKRQDFRKTPLLRYAFNHFRQRIINCSVWSFGNMISCAIWRQ